MTSRARARAAPAVLAASPVGPGAGSGAVVQSPLLVRRGRLWPLVVVSLALHVSLVAAVVILHEPTARIDLAQKPISARLVRLGEKRPEHFLPRKEAPPPEPAPAAAPQPAPAAVAKPAPPAAPVPRAPAAPPKPRPSSAAAGAGDALASALSRVRRDKALSEPVYGDPNGDPSGDSSEGEGDQYLALVVRALRDSYILPATLSEPDRARLQATVVLYLDQNGGLLRYAFEAHSGNDAFDSALERAIRAARIPPPPAD
ncbi:MAG TPA: TonB C-terminal domain-containing protein, partial [Anaeromyxobacteraceae bacterium]|nr:TonB C-terminal domain-containing protein [Anaeromyxobacteraceae bacterium]